MDTFKNRKHTVAKGSNTERRDEFVTPRLPETD